MKTRIFTLTLIAANFVILTTANAQRKAVNSLPAKQLPRYEKQATASPGCNTLNYPVPEDVTLVYYVTGTNGSDGYVAGPNIYGDKQKANYFQLKNEKFRYILGAKFYFAIANSTNPDNLKKNLFVRIYDVNTDGNPGNELYFKQLKFSRIAAATANQRALNFFFDSAVQLPSSGKFFVSLDISNLVWSASSTRDSLSLVTTEDGDVVPGQGWEQWSDDAWYDMNTGWGGFNTVLGIFPVVSETASGCSPAATASDAINAESKNVLQKNAALSSVKFANPFTGALKVQLNLATAQSVSARVYDLTGRLTAMEKPATFAAASNSIVLNSTANLKSGIYILKLNIGSEERTYKIVKQ